MAYTRTTWADGVTPVDASRLNNIEAGVDDHDGRLDAIEGPPTCILTKAAAQTISTASYTAIAFDSETKDTATMHESVTHPSYVTVPSAGLYMVTGCVEFALGTGSRVALIRKNGTTIAAAHMVASNDIYDKINISVLVDCAASDYIELFVWQNSGGDLDVRVASAYSPTLSVVKLY